MHLPIIALILALNKRLIYLPTTGKPSNETKFQCHRPTCVAKRAIAKLVKHLDANSGIDSFHSRIITLY